MNLLLASSQDRDGDTLCIEGRRALHVRKVLRAKVGDRIRVGLVRESIGSANVRSIVFNQVVLDDLQVSPAVNPPPLRLIIALPRPKALRRLLQTAASFGVEHIDIINAWRVDKSYWNSPLVTLDAMQEELWLGCEQGRHVWLPTIAVHRYLMPYLASLGSEERTLLLAQPNRQTWLSGVKRHGSAATIAIGPEGGWVEKEVVSFEETGFQSFSISNAILRSEIALAATLAQWELLCRDGG